MAHIFFAFVVVHKERRKRAWQYGTAIKQGISALLFGPEQP
jgi:hypothetical protein